MEYLVRWEINIEADSPEEAAAQAFVIQQDWQTEATTFEVVDENYNVQEIDIKNTGLLK